MSRKDQGAWSPAVEFSLPVELCAERLSQLELMLL